MSLLAQAYAAAQEAASIAWVMLKADMDNPRLLVRYVRTLRRCERYRRALLHTLTP
jgi:hypothetical protein